MSDGTTLECACSGCVTGMGPCYGGPLVPSCCWPDERCKHRQQVKSPPKPIKPAKPTYTEAQDA